MDGENKPGSIIGNVAYVARQPLENLEVWFAFRTNETNVFIKDQMVW